MGIFGNGGYRRGLVGPATVAMVPATEIIIVDSDDDLLEELIEAEVAEEIMEEIFYDD